MTFNEGWNDLSNSRIKSVFLCDQAPRCILWHRPVECLMYQCCKASDIWCNQSEGNARRVELAAQWWGYTQYMISKVDARVVSAQTSLIFTL